MRPISDVVRVWEPPADEFAPVLLTLHGTGTDEHDLVPIARALAPEAGVLAPRGPVLEDDGTPRFFRRIPTGGTGPYPFTFDDDEIGERARQLRDLLTSTLADEGLDDRPCYATGFSNGANMAAALLLLEPDLLRGALLFAPMPVLSRPPAPRLDPIGVWLAAGRQDPIATPRHVERLAGLLADRGAAVDVYLHNGGHEIPRTAVSAGAEWLRKVRAATGDPSLP